MDMLIMGAVNQTAQISSSWLKAACSWCLCLQMTSSDAKDLYSSKWKRFSAFTIGTLTMALTCLLYLVSAICWGSFMWPVLQEIIAFWDSKLSSTCKDHFITVFNPLRLLQMGALIGPMFISASLWGSFNEEMNCRQGSSYFLFLMFSLLMNFLHTYTSDPNF